jgi:hypothetical protein
MYNEKTNNRPPQVSMNIVATSFSRGMRDATTTSATDRSIQHAAFIIFLTLDTFFTCSFSIVKDDI